MRKRLLALVFAAFMAFTVTACSSEGGDSAGNENDNGTGDEQEQQQEEEPEVLDAGDLGDFYVAIGDCAFATDYDGNPVIIVNYDFTNNSDETVSPSIALLASAFQDGIELETAFVVDESVYDGSVDDLEVRPGATLTGCQSALELTSQSPVEFEIEEFLGDGEVLMKTFEVQQ